MRNPYAPVKGKCMWWREVPNEIDVHDIMIKPADKGIGCSCFVEGKVWALPTSDVPKECPEYKHCRYYIKSA